MIGCIILKRKFSWLGSTLPTKQNSLMRKSTSHRAEVWREKSNGVNTDTGYL
jgi:hypothetical protein